MNLVCIDHNASNILDVMHQVLLQKLHFLIYLYNILMHFYYLIIYHVLVHIHLFFSFPNLDDTAVKNICEYFVSLIIIKYSLFLILILLYFLLNNKLYIFDSQSCVLLFIIINI